MGDGPDGWLGLGGYFHFFLACHWLSFLSRLSEKETETKKEDIGSTKNAKNQNT